MFSASPSCRRLLLHAADLAEAFALASADNKSAARMAITAMTTRSSMRVKPEPGKGVLFHRRNECRISFCSAFMHLTTCRKNSHERVGSNPVKTYYLLHRDPRWIAVFTEAHCKRCTSCNSSGPSAAARESVRNLTMCPSL